MLLIPPLRFLVFVATFSITALQKTARVTFEATDALQEFAAVQPSFDTSVLHSRNETETKASRKAVDRTTLSFRIMHLSHFL